MLEMPESRLDPRAVLGAAGAAAPPTMFDALLDALSYVVDGSWDTFQRVADAVGAAVSDEVTRPSEVARVLSALGHIDLMIDRRTGRPTRFSVSPSTLLRDSRETSWLLCGHRSSQLLDSLTSAARQQGAEVGIEVFADQPARVRVTCATSAHDEIEKIAQVAGTAASPLRVNPGGPLSLALALPPLEEVLDRLQRLTPAGGGRIERLEADDRGGLRWQPVVDFAAAGSYRFDPPPVTYVFVDSAGVAPARVDPRLARLLAVLAAGAPPLAWDPSTGTAAATYWAEPPILYERALVLSSGIRPVARLDTRATEYADVPEEVAAAIHARLCAWGGVPQ